MLILTRREGEVVYIGKDIKVKVCGYHKTSDGDLRIRLGFEAPDHVRIVREEVKLRDERNDN